MFKGKDWKNTDGNVNLGVVIKVKRHKKKAKVRNKKFGRSGCLVVKVSACQPRDHGLEPYLGHDRVSSYDTASFLGRLSSSLPIIVAFTFLYIPEQRYSANDRRKDS
jgi:hypothetical protein